MARRAAKGGGTIRQRRDGRWEARYTVGRDPGTGKQVQRSVYGATQGEVRKKLGQITASLDNGTYKAPSKLTVAQWLDTWTSTYLGGVKPRTVDSYKSNIDNHLKPALGAVRLEALTTPMIQKFYNGLTTELTPKTVKNIHGILHHALQQAVAVGLLRFNPADACTLPRVEKKELRPLDEVESRAFLDAIKGHRFEILFTVTLFTGMREGEVLGLPWSAVDFQRGTITVKQQLQQDRDTRTEFALVPTKNSKARTITPAPFIMAALKRHRARQAEMRFRAGEAWEDSGLVFTDELGHHLTGPAIYHSFKKVAAAIGRPDARFHDLRHSYAVAAIRAGDDIKTVQDNLGHATASFTLDIYGHVTEQMKAASAARMEDYIKRITG